MTTESLIFLLPEIVLLVVATAIYVAGAFIKPRNVWSWAALGGIVLAGVVLGLQSYRLFELDLLFTAKFAPDALSVYIRWLALVVGGLLVLAASRFAVGRQAPEYFGTLLLAVMGLMLVGSADELVLVFLGLETISIPTYILLYVGRVAAPVDKAAPKEAAVKYFFLSILSSAILLYGFSYLYGMGGTTELSGLFARLSSAGLPEGRSALAAVAVMFIFAGLGFKMAAVPFQFYAPDVYQGTTHGNAALLSILPKAAAFVVLLRIGAAAMPLLSGNEGLGWRVTLILAVLTMTVGNVLALWQDNIRRLLAYSSIAHSGYMLIGLAAWFASSGTAEAGRFNGAGALLLYLVVYAVATAGTFAALVFLGRSGSQVNELDELAGLGSTRPAVAIALAIFMFSLAGVPPLAGFWGKFALFGSALGVDVEPGAAPWAVLLAGGSENALAGSQLWMWFLVLAIIGVLNAAIAAAYYLRIVGVMFFRPAHSVPACEGGLGAYAGAVLAAALTIALGFVPGPLFESSTNAAKAVHYEWQEIELATKVEADAVGRE